MSHLHAALASAGLVGAWQYEADAGEIRLEDLARLSRPRRKRAPRDATSLRIHRDDVAWLTIQVAGAVEGDGRVDVECRALSPDGSIRKIRNIGHAYGLDDGAPRGARGIALDVTKAPRPARADGTARAPRRLNDSIGHLIDARTLADDATVAALIDSALLAAGRLLARSIGRDPRDGPA